MFTKQISTNVVSLVIMSSQNQKLQLFNHAGAKGCHGKPTNENIPRISDLSKMYIQFKKINVAIILKM